MAEITPSLGGALLFSNVADTYSTRDPIQIRGFMLSGGSAAGAITLKEGISASDVADASGKEVLNVYAALGALSMLPVSINGTPFIANKGLKLSNLPSGASVTVYLA